MKKVERLIVAAGFLIMATYAGIYVNRGRERRAYTTSIKAMYRNRALIELYFRKNGRYPTQGATLSLSSIATAIDPRGSLLIAHDGWGYPFIYLASADGRHSWLISTGIDGKRQFATGQNAQRQRQVGADIAAVDGRFWQVWEGFTQCPEGIKDTPSDYLICEAHGGEDCNSELGRLCTDFER